MTNNTDSQQCSQETENTEDEAPETPPQPPSPPVEQHVCLNSKELQEFRTEQCSLYVKGACKDSKRCSMSHSETWPRRNPRQFGYECKLCPNIQFFRNDNKMQLSGKCSYGRRCKYSHSKEEQLYHPDLYKTRLCLNHPNCKGYYCPFAHSRDELRPRNENVVASYRENHQRSHKQGRQAPRVANRRGAAPLNETEYTAAPTPIDELQTRTVTDRITSRPHGESNIPERDTLDNHSLNSTVTPAPMLTRRQDLPISELYRTTMEHAMASLEGERHGLIIFNRYHMYHLGNGNIDRQPNPTVAEEQEYEQEEYELPELGTRHTIEDDEEDGWFDVVIRTGLQLLSEDSPEGETTENTNEHPVCQDCEAGNELCPLHNKLSQNWWI